MRYWINRRARELSLRFMYGLDVKSSDEPLSAVDVKYNISSFWSSNPVSSYYMLKKVRIDNTTMIIIGCSSLKNNRIFLRIVDYDKFKQIVSKVGKEDSFKLFLKNYNSNEKINNDDANFYKILRDLFANSRNPGPQCVWNGGSDPLSVPHFGPKTPSRLTCVGLKQNQGF